MVGLGCGEDAPAKRSKPLTPKEVVQGKRTLDVDWRTVEKRGATRFFERTFELPSYRRAVGFTVQIAMEVLRFYGYTLQIAMEVELHGVIDDVCVGDPD